MSAKIFFTFVLVAVVVCLTNASVYDARGLFGPSFLVNGGRQSLLDNTDSDVLRRKRSIQDRRVRYGQTSRNYNSDETNFNVDYSSIEGEFTNLGGQQKNINLILDGTLDSEAILNRSRMTPKQRNQLMREVRRLHREQRKKLQQGLRRNG